MKWNNHVVMITGASSGIGEAIAREAVSRGARVALLARRKDKLEGLARELERGEGSRRVLVCQCDVTRDGDMERAVAETRDAFGRIDVVIANAGYGVTGSFEDLTLEDYRAQFETNVFGVLRTAMAVLDDLKATKGSLALVGSVAGYLSAPGTIPYSMSKFAVRALAEGLAGEMKRKGVRVTHIAPGFVDSEIRKSDAKGNKSPERKDPIPSFLVMPAEQAAREVLDAIAKGEGERVITMHGKALVWLTRRAPRLVATLVGVMGKPPGMKKD